MNLKPVTFVKSLQRYIGCVPFIVNTYIILPRNCFHYPFFLQKDTKFEVTDSTRDCMFRINPNLANAATLFLRLHLPEKQLVIMYDASEDAADYVLQSGEPKDTAECAITYMHRLHLDII